MALDPHRVTFSSHFLAQMKVKRISPDAIIVALIKPEQVTDVRGYPGQLRYCGGGVAVVADGHHCVTLYLDRVITPLRDDQKNDANALASKRLNR